MSARWSLKSNGACEVNYAELFKFVSLVALAGACAGVGHSDRSLHRQLVLSDVLRESLGGWVKYEDTLTGIKEEFDKIRQEPFRVPAPAKQDLGEERCCLTGLGGRVMGLEPLVGDDPAPVEGTEPTPKRKRPTEPDVPLAQLAAPLIRALEQDISFRSHTDRDDQITVHVPRHLTDLAKGTLQQRAQPLFKAAEEAIERAKHPPKVPLLQRQIL